MSNAISLRVLRFRDSYTGGMLPYILLRISYGRNTIAYYERKWRSWVRAVLVLDLFVFDAPGIFLPLLLLFQKYFQLISLHSLIRRKLVSNKNVIYINPSYPNWNALRIVVFNTYSRYIHNYLWTINGGNLNGKSSCIRVLYLYLTL
jgi:hypothetical protein